MTLPKYLLKKVHPFEGCIDEASWLAAAKKQFLFIYWLLRYNGNMPSLMRFFCRDWHKPWSGFWTRSPTSAGRQIGIAQQIISWISFELKVKLELRTRGAQWPQYGFARTKPQDAGCSFLEYPMLDLPLVALIAVRVLPIASIGTTRLIPSALNNFSLLDKGTFISRRTEIRFKKRAFKGVYVWHSESNFLLLCTRV